MSLPDYLKAGEPARLIPVISDTRKEQRATSVLMAVLTVVPEFADRLFAPLGHRVGKRTTVNSFTEVVLDKGLHPEKDRPDGLLELVTGKRKWIALIEAKIGSAQLEKEQIERYLQLARDNELDAVITISNEFATRPTHHPLTISKVLTRRVELFHLSWTSIFTDAVILHENSAISDPDQAYLLREFIRFLSHDSVGVTGYKNMPARWKEVVDLVVNGARLSPRADEIEEIVGGWHQEMRDLALIMSRDLGEAVQLRMSRAHSNDPDSRMKRDIGLLCNDAILRSRLIIPNAASELTVVADLRARTLTASMTVDAPTNIKRSTARLRWLLRQIKAVDPTNVFVTTIWPSRAPNTVLPIQVLREDDTVLQGRGKGAAPRAFEVSIKMDGGRRFGGRKTFIEDIENLVPEFYERIGQHLRAWQPAPPKPIKSDSQEEASEPEVSTTVPVTPGNAYTNLLDVPPFLRRPPGPMD